MKPILLAGEPALAAFRLDRLLAAMRAAVPERVESVKAAFVYIIEADGRLSRETMSRSLALLGAHGEFVLDRGFMVTPRKGTISPWSSKATDIFRNCGLAQVRRVERGVHYAVVDRAGRALAPDELRPALGALHDRMTEGVYTDVSDIFRHIAPRPFAAFDVLGEGRAALERANASMGLALSAGEIDYLCQAYEAIRRNPTDVELLMFGQVNSEHCRHKIFNAAWVVDGRPQDRSLFDMIRHTHAASPAGVLVAYRDNAAVLEGFDNEWFLAGGAAGGHVYGYVRAPIDIVMKVETHNHPTAIAPYPGAATGVGGEIRDEAATGIGGRSKAGLSGFMVSHLRVPGWPMPWERDIAPFPSRLATPLAIMLDGPIGGARFGNEFGRPQLFGLFRTFEQECMGRHRGYHKPIMVAGGMGNIRREHARKRDIPAGARIVQLGGPAMRIGLGGGAASSMTTGSNEESLDYDSVQRDNAEMQRRCQGVIDACIALGPANPILSIHDLGAGGLSNGCPELVAETGGRFELRRVPSEDSSMSPMEIWCCEAQERYVLAIAARDVDRFLALCARERCPAAVIGEATGDGHLSLSDEHFGNRPIDIDLGVILGKPPRMLRQAARREGRPPPLDLGEATVAEAAERVLRLPAVAAKTFLIAIADRSVTGLVARDQMAGPYQAPVSDVAVTATGFKARTGEAMTMGERTPLALIDGPASARMAIGEALTNIAAACIGAIGAVKLSANWMCACGEPGEDAELFATVRAAGMEACPSLGLAIPVGKDSLSMRTVWRTPDGAERRQTAPLSLVVSAFAPVRDAGRTVTPDLKPRASRLFLVDLGAGRNRLGGSALAQVYGQVGNDAPDLDDPARLRGFFGAVQEMVANGLLLAYHDRSDGGLFAAVAEMAIAGRLGATVDIGGLGGSDLAALFSEELGAVLQVADECVADVECVLARHGLGAVAHRVGQVDADSRGRGASVAFLRGGARIYARPVRDLARAWYELTSRMQALRDNPECARQEYDALLDETDPGMSFAVAYDPAWAPTVSAGARPRVAVLREQGVNGHIEMAAAFDRAGFECVDVHMTDLLGGGLTLDGMRGLVACGGFSYGDVLGAGSGWARSILFNETLCAMFRAFFERPDTFALGVCNGCQMLSQLRGIIPGAGDWPEFRRNRSEQFEARYATVEILPSPSVLLAGMEGSRLPIAVAHGEGRAVFGAGAARDALEAGRQIAVRYVDNRGAATEQYPLNPNGSPGGITGLTSADGRATILMPHPERGFRSLQLSYSPPGLFPGEDGPWMRMFRNARAFAG